MKKVQFVILSVFFLTSGCNRSENGTEADTTPKVKKQKKDFSDLKISKNWERICPRSSGWNMDKLGDVIDIFDDNKFSALVVIHRGKMVLGLGEPSKRYKVYSMRKSFVSALYGIYSEKGKIDLSQKVTDTKIEFPEALSDTEKSATIVDLLMAKSGIYLPAALETDSMKKKRPVRGAYPSGTFWYYNNWDFNALGRIFIKKTGKTPFQAFYDDIALPTGMQDYRVSDGGWVNGKKGEMPGYYFNMSARDCARFGELFLRSGKWRGNQVIPAKWITDSIKPMSSAGKGISYGYMWWVSPGKKHIGVETGKGTFSARGNWGQYIIVIPSLDMVVVKLVDKNSGAKKKNRKETADLLQKIIEAAPDFKSEQKPAGCGKH
ncbi:beta-lactamase family protein [Myxococcota bacterium]|nr:beta-lactamase family protein [Myxococcota bacterium]MBU1380532.1 beta-lactamase family protein [Myxococcota bacterium]MBU1497303.1 beta-lactamase family protein [Myxococcota bacterium]